MLSDRQRFGLRKSLEIPREVFGEDVYAKIVKAGPAAFVDVILDCKDTIVESHEAIEELRENRDEAIQFVAALMGMT